jgi:hypothetical protein
MQMVVEEYIPTSKLKESSNPTTIAGSYLKGGPRRIMEVKREHAFDFVRERSAAPATEVEGEWDNIRWHCEQNQMEAHKHPKISSISF